MEASHEIKIDLQINKLSILDLVSIRVWHKQDIWTEDIVKVLMFLMQ
jgi:hypothetical protein